WLSFVHENIRANISILESDFDKALDHTRRCEELSGQCGDMMTHAVTLCNLGHLLYLTGHFDEAFQNCSRALKSFLPGSDNAWGAIDNLAQIRLAQGDLDGSEQLLRQIKPHQPFSSEPGRYVHRHGLITRSRLCGRRGDLEEARRIASTAA